MVNQPVLSRVSTYSLGGLVAVVLGAFSGVAVSLAMPHGPATAAQALLVMLAGVLVGMAAGWSMRSRWAMLLARSLTSSPSSWRGWVWPERP